MGSPASSNSLASSLRGQGQLRALCGQAGHLGGAQRRAVIDLHSAGQHHDQRAPALGLRQLQPVAGRQAHVQHIHGREAVRRPCRPSKLPAITRTRPAPPGSATAGICASRMAW